MVLCKWKPWPSFFCKYAVPTSTIKDDVMKRLRLRAAAKQVGLVPDFANDHPKDSGSNKRRRHQAEQGVAALNFGEVFEVVPGMDVYQYRDDNGCLPPGRGLNMNRFG